jgi:hypothetical protein
VLRRVDDRNGGDDVLGEPDLRACPSAGADRLHGEAMGQHAVVTDLVQLPRRQPQARRKFDVHRVAAADVEVQPLVAHVHERVELVDREEVADPVAQHASDVAGVVGERPHRVHRLPPAVAVLKSLRQIPVVQRGERLDPSLEQFVDETAVEIDARRVRLTSALREDPRPRHREPIGVGADRAHQVDVLDIPVVVMATSPVSPCSIFPVVWA